MLAFYYPQDTTVAIGATQVIPGTQYWNVDREDSGNTAGEDRLDLRFDRDRVGASDDLVGRDAMIERQWRALDPYTPPQFVEVEKGTVLLVHFDLFHRGTRNSLQNSRYLFKFEFTRTLLPSQCNGRDMRPDFDKLTDSRRRPIVESIANWISGRTTNATESANNHVESEDLEANRIASAYLRGRHDDSALVEDFHSGIERKRRAAIYGMTQSPRLVLESALGMLETSRVSDRAAGAFLLGELLQDDEQAIEELIAVCRNDENSDVRANAVTALGKIGSKVAGKQTSSKVVPIVDAILGAAMSKLDVPSSRVLGTNNIRQLAWLALLRIVCSSIAEQNGLKTSSQIVAAAKLALDREVDRYARQTAREVLLRLAEFGDDQATRLATTVLRNEQWCVSPS